VCLNDNFASSSSFGPFDVAELCKCVAEPHLEPHVCVVMCCVKGCVVVSMRVCECVKGHASVFAVWVKEFC